MASNNTTTFLWPCDSVSFTAYAMVCVALFRADRPSSVFSFFLAAESIIGLMSLLMNCAATIATYYTQPLSVEHRQSLVSWMWLNAVILHVQGAISLNYALISGVILARASFLIFSVYTTCNTTVNTLNCKLQEFPLVFVYIQAAFLAILLGLQFLKKSRYIN